MNEVRATLDHFELSNHPTELLLMNGSTSKQLSKWCKAGALALVLALVPTRAPAVEVPVLLADVGVGKQVPDLRSQMRSMLSEELAATNFANVKTHERFPLSATLVRLDNVVDHESVRSTCVVSVALLRDKGATLHAVIRGRATAEEAKGEVEAAQSDALRAAVHSAITRVPQALR